MYTRLWTSLLPVQTYLFVFIYSLCCYRSESKFSRGKMQCLKRLFRRLSHTRQTRQNRPQQDAAILLQMPIDIILLISEQLPRQSLYTLYQSCYSLQTILRHHFHLETSGVSQDRTQSLNLFSCLSQDLLDRLVCDRCATFFENQYKKFPTGDWREYQLNTMMPGCKRSNRCLWQCCHPPHLCACFRRRCTPYIQKQHVELVLEYAEPSANYTRSGDDTVIPTNRMYAQGRCRLRWKPVPSQPNTTYHYTIMSRVVQGRLLLFRQIRWTNDYLRDLRSLSALHLVCPVMQCQRISMFDRPHECMYIESESYGYGRFKCFYCMSEYTFKLVDGEGIIRIWQDLGSEENPTHECCMDMDFDEERARSKDGRIAERFGTV